MYRTIVIAFSTVDGVTEDPDGRDGTRADVEHLPFRDSSVAGVLTGETEGPMLEIGCAGRGRLVDRTEFEGRVVGVDIRKAVQGARVDPHLMLVVFVSFLQSTERAEAIAELACACVSTAPCRWLKISRDLRSPRHSDCFTEHWAEHIPLFTTQGAPQMGRV